jgi:V8-like Glu-specific endopeptidase
MYTHDGKYLKINNDRIKYFIDTSSGNSGSPVYRI